MAERPVPEKNSPITVSVCSLHENHPKLRAKDWRAPLVIRLLEGAEYKDSHCELFESFRPPAASVPLEGTLSLSWHGMQSDVDQTEKTYQEPVITEFATLGLACILLTLRANAEITEVTRRGERADYWLGDREMLLEVSGQKKGSLDSLSAEKIKQLTANPFGKAGYICVASYEHPSARLWFCEGEKNS